MFDSNRYEEQIESFVTQHPELDGISVSGDLMALHVIKACQALGKEVLAPREQKAHALSLHGLGYCFIWDETNILGMN